jgi:hypothetical protein
MVTDLNQTMHRVRTARVLVVVVFFILRAGDACFWLFSLDRANPWPAMMGVIVGSLLATTALLVALWRRSTWSRIVLIGLLWMLIAVFSFPGLLLTGESASGSRRALIPLVAGVLAYVTANVVLISSHRLHRLGSPRGCGDS